VRFNEAYFFQYAFFGLLRKCTRFEILEVISIDIAGFQDMELCNKLAGRPYFLPQSTDLVEQNCNLNQKYLIMRKYFALFVAFSLCFLQAGRFDSSCLYYPFSGREIVVKIWAYYQITSLIIFIVFFKLPRVNSETVHSKRTIKTSSYQILNY
jgi:hypothetical protein